MRFDKLPALRCYTRGRFTDNPSTAATSLEPRLSPGASPTVSASRPPNASRARRRCAVQCASNLRRLLAACRPRSG